MNRSCLIIQITAISEFIASCIEDDDELALAGAVFTQLGDTLATISLQRDICNKRQEAENEKEVKKQ